MSRLIEWESVCLVCLQKRENRFIFAEDDDSNVIADKIMKCADILIKRDTIQIKNICLQCLEDLNVAYKFRRNCEQSDSIIKALLKANQEIQIKDSWKRTPITMNSTHEIYIKNELVDDDVAEGPYNDESTHCLGLEDDPDTEIKLVEDFPEAWIHGNDVESINKKSSKSNKMKQKANNEISIPPSNRPSTEKSRAKPKGKLGYKKPLKICEICNHTFRGQNTLDNHMRRHNKERRFSCDHCDKGFVTRTELRRHVRMYTGQKPYECQYCDRRFAVDSERKNHERTHTGERPYLCLTCGKSFAYSHVLTKHLRIHSGLKDFVCKECGKGFTRKVHFEKHVAHHLNRDELNKSPEHLQEKRLKKGNFQIEGFVNLNEIHIKHEIGNNSPCRDIEDETGTKVHVEYGACVQSNAVELTKVKGIERSMAKQEADCEISRRLRGQPDTFTEESCDKSNPKSAYRKPLKACKICNRGFRGQNGLDNHMRRHNNERPFACDQCDKAFVTTTELQRHVITHTGQRPYKCQHCDRRFPNYTARKNHERTHTGERPFVCATCGKSFAYSHVLTDHSRIHTGEFLCKECGKGFTKKVYLEKHLARHTTRDELDKLSERKQEKRLEKEIFQVEECAISNEINIKHEVEIIEEEIN